ncbi:hypothetical protein FKM82_000587 [Ascaphus truei]
MKMTNSVYTVIRFSLLISGFSLVCLGAFHISSSYVCNCGNEMILVYSLLPLGFLLLLAGIFWSTYHEANHKSLFRTMIRRAHNRQDVHINTVDRPDFYPPSYDSIIREIHLHPETNFHIREAEESYNIPPPLYTESTVDIVDETYACEGPPPSYEASVQMPSIVTESSPEEDQGPVNANELEACD